MAESTKQSLPANYPSSFEQPADVQRAVRVLRGSPQSHAHPRGPVPVQDDPSPHPHVLRLISDGGLPAYVVASRNLDQQRRQRQQQQAEGGHGQGLLEPLFSPQDVEDSDESR